MYREEIMAGETEKDQFGERLDQFKKSLDDLERQRQRWAKTGDHPYHELFSKLLQCQLDMIILLEERVRILEKP